MKGFELIKPTYEQLHKKVIFYRLFSTGMIAFIVFIGINNVSTTEKARELEKKAIENRKIADNWKFEYQQSVIDCQGYKEANEALIKYSTPLSVDHAIKATPLPKIKEV